MPAGRGAPIDARKNQYIRNESRDQVEWFMAYNFLRGDRDQPFLLPPDLRDWLRACQAEWKLLCGTHNLLKLWRHQATPPSASPATI
jgi:hypothetical protein